MNPDIELKNDVAIYVRGFETRYLRRADGTLKTVDYAIYSPIGDSRSVNERPIDELQKVRPLEDCGDNIASLVARRTWDIIRPMWEHWKSNNALPESGTPLAAWPGVTAAQADVLRKVGLRTVEDIAAASEIILTKTGLPNAVVLGPLAKKFLEAGQQAESAAKTATLEQQNAELREQMAEMQRMMADMMAESKPRRGKQAAASEPAAEAVAA